MDAGRPIPPLSRVAVSSRRTNLSPSKRWCGGLFAPQEYVKEKLGEGAEDRPCTFVFHGGSGSSEEDIAIAVKVRGVSFRVEGHSSLACLHC